jgi:hypothetical protein
MLTDESGIPSLHHHHLVPLNTVVDPTMNNMTHWLTEWLIRWRSSPEQAEPGNIVRIRSVGKICFLHLLFCLLALPLSFLFSHAVFMCICEYACIFTSRAAAFCILFACVMVWERKGMGWKWKGQRFCFIRQFVYLKFTWRNPFSLTLVMDVHALWFLLCRGGGATLLTQFPSHMVSFHVVQNVTGWFPGREEEGWGREEPGDSCSRQSV